MVASVALASAEFEKVDNQVKTSTEGVLLGVPDLIVSCESAGQGKVASSTKVQLEVKYNKCKATIGELVKDAAAKVSTCTFALTAGGELTLSHGCIIEASGCTVEPAESKQGKAVSFSNVKTEEKGGNALESEIEVEPREIAYKVNSTCEKLGAKGGKEMAIDEYAAAQGVVVVPTHLNSG
jgi:hypothetical protein